MPVVQQINEDDGASDAGNGRVFVNLHATYHTPLHQSQLSTNQRSARSSGVRIPCGDSPGCPPTPEIGFVPSLEMIASASTSIRLISMPMRQ